MRRAQHPAPVVPAKLLLERERAGNTPRARALGHELRNARSATGHSQRAFADLLGVSNATVSRWETGERMPKPEEVAVFLAKADVPSEAIERLMSLSSEPDPEALERVQEVAMSPADSAGLIADVISKNGAT